MSKITLDNLSDNLKEYLEGLGLSEEQVLNLINENGLDEEELKAMLKDTMSINELNTNSKTVIGAINELFQSANNGKELIASAIGEPLSSEDTFSAMSDDINGLLSTFKINMMNNGITVESNDRFKSLIDKIATMVEEGEGKGIQFVEGSVDANTHWVAGKPTLITGTEFYDTQYLYKIPKMDFEPLFLYAEYYDPHNYWYSISVYFKTPYHDQYYYLPYSVYSADYGATDSYDLDTSIHDNPVYLFKLDSDEDYYYMVSAQGVINANEDSVIKYYAIGIGEEDTTLRDSLANILEEEGVTTTDEDDMASLITKVDQEFDEKRQELSNILTNKGFDINTNESYDSMIDKLGSNNTKLLQLEVDKIELHPENYGNSISKIITKDGRLFAAGVNERATLICKNQTNVFTMGYSGTDVKTACSHDESYVYILKTDGTVWYDGSSGLTSLSISNVKMMKSGSRHTIFVTNNDEIYGEGRYCEGQLGRYYSEDYSSSSLEYTELNVGGTGTVKEISCNFVATAILYDNGELWVSGKNNYNHLGDHGGEQWYFIKTLDNVRSVSLSENYFTAVAKNDGTLWVAGDNSIGQLGLGNTTTSYQFVQVNGMSDVKQVSCGYYHTMLVKNDGSLWACGYNNSGQLGLGNTTNQTTFTQVSSVGNDVKEVYCASNYTIIIKNDGTVWACGDNTYGQLGLGDTTNRTTFTQTFKNISLYLSL